MFRNLIYRLLDIPIPEPTKEEYVKKTVNDIIKIIKSNKGYFKQLCGNGICSFEHVADFDFVIADYKIDISIHFDNLFPDAIFLKVGPNTIYDVYGNQYEGHINILTTKIYNNMFIDDIYFYCLHELEFRLIEAIEDYKKNGNKYECMREEIGLAAERARVRVGGRARRSVRVKRLSERARV